VPTPDLAAYFARVGYTGPRDATVATLTAIHQHHARAIPFENLDVLLGRGISLEPAAIERKLVRDRRGGYCFEQNGLLRDVLRALGFRVTPLIARVRWQVPDHVVTALTHMVLRVDLGDHAFIADVGFGSRSLFTPLALEFDREQTGSLDPRRLMPRGSLVVHQTRTDDTWGDVYHFTLDEAPAVDFELGNWFTSTHPQSRFKLNLVAARAGDGCRSALFNREFTVRHADGRAEKRELATPDELLGVLAEFFRSPLSRRHPLRPARRTVVQLSQRCSWP
jgi:N-hydroxyarylamine O-acetyltransferase